MRSERFNRTENFGKLFHLFVRQVAAVADDSLTVQDERCHVIAGGDRPAEFRAQELAQQLAQSILDNGRLGRDATNRCQHGARRMLRFGHERCYADRAG